MATPSRVRPRAVRRVPIHGTAFFLNAEIHGRGFVWNLSPTGCRVDAEKNVPAGTTLTITLYLDNADERIHVHRAMVAWSRGHECGLRLTDIDESQARRPKHSLRRTRAPHASD